MKYIRRKRGFTLIEILIVIVIIGILATVVVIALAQSAKEKARIADGQSLADSVRARGELEVYGNSNVGNFWKLNEDGGTAIGDYWGRSDGTLFTTTAPGPQWIQGMNGSALDFNNAGYIALNSYYSSVGEISELTVCAWIQTTSVGSNNWAILDFDRSDYFNFYTDSAGGVGFSTSGGAGSGIGDMYGVLAVNDGKWHHVCGTYDSTKTNDKAIFVDGKLDSESDQHNIGEGLGTGVTRYGFIGDGSEADTFNGGRNTILFDGVIDEVQFYHKAMGITQIRKIYAESSTKYRMTLK
ncbi:LamG domain-containing protein [Patescibacteria group bacterium]